MTHYNVSRSFGGLMPLGLEAYPITPTGEGCFCPNSIDRRFPARMDMQ